MIIKQIETQKRFWSFEFVSDFACPLQLSRKGSSDLGFGEIIPPASVHRASRILHHASYFASSFFTIDKTAYLVYQSKTFSSYSIPAGLLQVPKWWNWQTR
jgi:hypothetical protein